MKYYVDGFTKKSNPSKTGGGFTIVDENNKLVFRKNILQNGFTNNEAELLGCFDALNRAKNGDTIFVDSKVVISWITNPFRKKRAREDLDGVKLQCKKMLEKKKIRLIWEDRSKNKAGIYNEKINKVRRTRFIMDLRC